MSSSASSHSKRRVEIEGPALGVLERHGLGHPGGDPVEGAPEHEPPVQEPLEPAVEVEGPAREPAHRGDLVVDEIRQLAGVELQAHAVGIVGAGTDVDARRAGRQCPRGTVDDDDQVGEPEGGEGLDQQRRGPVQGGGKVHPEEAVGVDRGLLTVHPRAHVDAHGLHPLTTAPGRPGRHGPPAATRSAVPTSPRPPPPP